MFVAPGDIMSTALIIVAFGLHAAANSAQLPRRREASESQLSAILPDGAPQPFECRPPCSTAGACVLNGTSSLAHCACRPGFGGSACEQCLPGFFGRDCTPCQTKCNPTNDANAHFECDDGIGSTGDCRCVRAYAGERCDKCAAGYVGTRPAGILVCEDPTCGNGIKLGNATCICNPGWTSDAGDPSKPCSTIAPGYYRNRYGDVQVCPQGCTRCRALAADSDAVYCTDCSPQFAQYGLPGYCPGNAQCGVMFPNAVKGGLMPTPGYTDSKGVCQPCHDMCSTCFGPTHKDCASCWWPGYVDCKGCPARAGGYGLLEGECVPLSSKKDGRCWLPAGDTRRWYLNPQTKKCDACPTGCSDCMIPNFNMTTSTWRDVVCTSCFANKFLRNNRCVDSCLPNEFVDSADGVTCRSCHADCAACRGPSANDCISCQLGTPQRLALNGTCVASCPKKGYFAATYRSKSDGTSAVVPAALYTDGLPPNSCQACHPDCDECAGPGMNECTTCGSIRNMTLVMLENRAKNATAVSVGIGQCVDRCPTGMALNDSTGTCKDCDRSCRACAISANASTCLSCPAASVLFKNGTDVYGQCVDKCPPGMVAGRSKICEGCHPSCSVCSSPANASTCLACADSTLNLVSGECVVLPSQASLQSVLESGIHPSAAVNDPSKMEMASDKPSVPLWGLILISLAALALGIWMVLFAIRRYNIWRRPTHYDWWMLKWLRAREEQPAADAGEWKEGEVTGAKKWATAKPLDKAGPEKLTVKKSVRNEGWRRPFPRADSDQLLSDLAREGRGGEPGEGQGPMEGGPGDDEENMIRFSIASDEPVSWRRPEYAPRADTQFEQQQGCRQFLEPNIQRGYQQEPPVGVPAQGDQLEYAHFRQQAQQSQHYFERNNNSARDPGESRGGGKLFAARGPSAQPRPDLDSRNPFSDTPPTSEPSKSANRPFRPSRTLAATPASPTLASAAVGKHGAQIGVSGSTAPVRTFPNAPPPRAPRNGGGNSTGGPV